MPARVAMCSMQVGERDPSASSSSVASQHGRLHRRALRGRRLLAPSVEAIGREYAATGLWHLRAQLVCRRPNVVRGTAVL